jgi:hypothetical protein
MLGDAVVPHIADMSQRAQVEVDGGLAGHTVTPVRPI